MTKTQVQQVDGSASPSEQNAATTRAQEQRDAITTTVSWPRPLDADALQGLPGDFVRLVLPETEADQAALLFSYLVAVGSIIGRGPHYPVGGDRHYTNLFVVIVAESSKGRKGTSWGEVRRLVSLVESKWLDQCCSSGLSSGEGLIWNVRDPIVEERPMREDPTKTEERIIDNGVADKRLFVHEGELSQPLQAIARDGNILSAVIREAWDSAPLRALTKNSKAVCLKPHVSILGHITAPELRRLLTTNETGNGFANRFMWVCASRSKCLPFGGSVDAQALAYLAARTSKAISFARKVETVEFGQDARDHWWSVYPRLSEGRPGLLGAVTARSEAQAVRLAMVYALLEESQQIRIEYWRASPAAWRYCEDSAKFIFGGRLGDPTADGILQFLRASKDGVTRNEIMNHFKRNKPSAEIGRALSVLQSLGLARCSTSPTGGRNAEFWSAVHERNEFNEATE